MVRYPPWYQHTRYVGHLLVLVDYESEEHLRQTEAGESDVIGPLHAQNAAAPVVHLEHFRFYRTPAVLRAQAETA